MNVPPKPKKIRKNLVAHKDKRIDWYYWLRDDERKNNEVLNHLKQENKYSSFWYKENKVNSKKIYSYYKNKIPKFEQGFKTKLNNYQYFSTASISQEHRRFYQVHKKKKI